MQLKGIHSVSDNGISDPFRDHDSNHDWDNVGQSSGQFKHYHHQRHCACVCVCVCVCVCMCVCVCVCED